MGFSYRVGAVLVTASRVKKERRSMWHCIPEKAPGEGRGRSECAEHGV